VVAARRLSRSEKLLRITSAPSERRSCALCWFGSRVTART
jgi:hypothetical protein